MLYHIYMLFLVVTTDILGDVFPMLSFVINRVRVVVRSNRFNGPFLIADEDLASVACRCAGLVIRMDHGRPRFGVGYEYRPSAKKDAEREDYYRMP